MTSMTHRMHRTGRALLAVAAAALLVGWAGPAYACPGPHAKDQHAGQHADQHATDQPANDQQEAGQQAGQQAPIGSPFGGTAPAQGSQSTGPQTLGLPQGAPSDG